MDDQRDSAGRVAGGVTAAEAGTAAWGSDVVAQLLRRFGLPYLAINPGASYRGLHDSIVNLLGNAAPELLVVLHEAQAVGIAHGYAKVTGRPLGVVLHSNVGLMNAVMAIYNAWCDRVPMLILGATGAVDAARRRPWIEWLHTSRDQGGLIRNFVKWDDQPASVPAAVESLLRAWQITRARPHAPVYVCLDVSLQEDPLAAPVPLPDDLALYDPAPPGEPPAAAVAAAWRLLGEARRPLLAVGRVARTDPGWAARVALAERLGAAVLCDQKCGIGFPGAHPLAAGAPAQYLTPRARDALDGADLVFSLDWPDLGGLLRQRRTGAAARVISVSPDHELHNGWALDHFSLTAADLRLGQTPEAVVDALLAAAPAGGPRPGWLPPPPPAMPVTLEGTITMTRLAAAFDRARGDRPVSLVRLPFGWPDERTRITGPLDCLGYDGGGGIGSTPGIAVGAALALRGSGRLPVAILGDGDLLMGAQALWTAARQRLPLLLIVNNNRSFYNDVEHQEAVARRRGRPVANRFIGMELDDPAVDLAGLARAQGCLAHGPVEDAAVLADVLERAFAEALAGAVVLVDVRVEPGPIAQ